MVGAEGKAESVVGGTEPSFPDATAAADYVVQNERALAFDAQFRKFAVGRKK